MDYSSPQLFVIDSDDDALKIQFIETVWKIFGSKKHPEDPQRFSIEISNDWVNVTVSEKVLPDEKFSKIIVTNNMQYHLPSEPQIPTLIFVVLDSPNHQPQQKDGLCQSVYAESISYDSVKSFMTYSLIFVHCFLLQIHDRKPITSPLLLDHLKRLFRSLDTDFDQRITFDQLSNFHFEIFHRKLSTFDYEKIFEFLKDAEPLRIDQLGNYSLTFEDFLSIINSFVEKGYGEVVFQLLKHASFHKYFQPNKNYNIIPPQYNSSNLIPDARKFLTNVYNDLGDFPNPNNLRILFSQSGGVPIRFRNMLQITLNDWLSIWNDFGLLEVQEAARNLLSLGYPKEQIASAFGIEIQKVEGVSTLSIAIISTGLLTIAAFLGFSLYRKRH